MINQTPLPPDSGHLSNTLSRALPQWSMILRFSLNSESDQFQEMVVVLSVPQWSLNIDLFLREKAAS